MKRHFTGDVWTDAKLLHAEERVAEARAFTARWALLRDSRPPRRGVRVWLRSLLLAAGHRLLDSVRGSRVRRRKAAGTPPAERLGDGSEIEAVRATELRCAAIPETLIAGLADHARSRLNWSLRDAR
jgi:hypothetical protein